MLFVYLIACEKNKWYVSTTMNPEHAFRRHRYGPGSAWTQKYEVKELVKSVRVSGPNSARGFAQYYQSMYGRSNVFFEEMDYATLMKCEEQCNEAFTRASPNPSPSLRSIASPYVSPISTPERKPVAAPYRYMPPFKLS